MAVVHQKSEAIIRGARMLRTALGPAIAGFLEDPAIVEVMLNPDGRLWIDRLSEGLSDTGERLNAADGERIVRLVAHHVGSEVHAGSPRVSAELPETGERFEGLLPPVVAAPTFAIRKPAVAVFTLNDYVAAAIMTSDQAEALRAAVAARQNSRSRGADRGYPRAAMPGAESRGAPNQRRGGVAVRSRALLVTPAPRPHSDRRSPRRRGAGSLEGLGHRPPRRRRHHPRRQRARRGAPSRAADPGSRRHRSARVDRRDHRCRRGAFRPWQGTPAH